MILISVIIPLYNNEKYIAECIDSITDNYEYNDIEIIVVNDGSTDRSADIVRSMIDKDKRIVMINQDNRGPSEARNRGLEEAQGKHILFVDSDDFLENETLNQCRDLLVEESYDTIIINFKRHTKDNKVFNNKPLFDDAYTYDEMNKKEIYIKLVSTGDLNSLHAKFYNNKIIKENNIRFNKNITIGEDRLFNLDYFYFSNNGIYYNLYLYNYRYNPTSLTKTFKISKFFDIKQTHSIRMEYIKKYGLEQDTINKANNYTLNSLYNLVAIGINMVSLEKINEAIDDPVFIKLFNETKAEGIRSKLRILILRRKWFKLLRFLQKLRNQQLS